MQLIQIQIHPNFPGLFLHPQATVLPQSMGMVHPLKLLLIYPMPMIRFTFPWDPMILILPYMESDAVISDGCLASTFSLQINHAINLTH